jgi:dephospho-CoA kinase
MSETPNSASRHKRTGAIALAGPLGAGKSTVARALRATLGAAGVAFGDYVRAETVKRGLPADRATWQRVGAEIRQELGPDGFCRAVLEGSGLSREDVPIIWDGVRHPEILAALRRLYQPAPVNLIVLLPPEAKRRQHLRTEADSEIQIDKWEGHESEQHLNELLALADFVSTAETAAAMVAEVEAFLS